MPPDLTASVGETSPVPKGGLILNRRQLMEEVAIGIETLMGDKVSRAELAKRLGCSRSFVTKTLDGAHNFTLATLADVFAVLGRKVHLVLSADMDTMRAPRDEAIPGEDEPRVGVEEALKLTEQMVQDCFDFVNSRNLADRQELSKRVKRSAADVESAIRRLAGEKP